MNAQALIGFGQVRHARLKPTRHDFDYPTYFLMLPMRSLQRTPGANLARNRRAALSFYDQDHGDGRGPGQERNAEHGGESGAQVHDGTPVRMRSSRIASPQQPGAAQLHQPFIIPRRERCHPGFTSTSGSGLSLGMG